jgi:hypothetical protein
MQIRSSCLVVASLLVCGCAQKISVQAPPTTSINSSIGASSNSAGNIGQDSLMHSSSEAIVLPPIVVEWLPAPERMLTTEWLSLDNRLNTAIKVLVSEYEQNKDVLNLGERLGPPERKNSDAITKDFNKNFSVWKMGTVQGGALAGSTLYQLTGGCSDWHLVCSSKDLISKILITPKNDWYQITQYSGYIEDVYFRAFGLKEADIHISNLTVPAQVRISGSTLRLVQVATLPQFSFGQSSSSDQNDRALSMFLESTTGTKIFYGDYCYTAKYQDGSTAYYNVDFPLVTNSEYPLRAWDGAKHLGIGVLDMTWNDGKKNQSEYDPFDSDDCSYDPCYHLSRIPAKDPLEVVATLSTGESVYREKLSEDLLNKDPYDIYLKNSAIDAIHNFGAVGNWYVEFARLRSTESVTGIAEKISFKEFYNEIPIIFIRDPFGQMIMFVRRDFRSLVGNPECAADPIRGPYP